MPLRHVHKMTRSGSATDLGTRNKRKCLYKELTKLNASFFSFIKDNFFLLMWLRSQ